MTEEMVRLHTVHITFYNLTPIEKRMNILERFKNVSEQCGGKEAGILAWAFDNKIPNDKYVNVVEFAVFRDDAAFETLRRHPEHQALRKELSGVADWIGADIYVPRSLFEGLV